MQMGWYRRDPELHMHALLYKVVQYYSGHHWDPVGTVFLENYLPTTGVADLQAHLNNML